MNVLDFVLKMSLSGSILFLVILLFRPITKKVFNETWNYYMLVATLLVFIVPLSFFVKVPNILDYKVHMNIRAAGNMSSQTVDLNGKNNYKNTVDSTSNNNDSKNMQTGNNVETSYYSGESKEEPQTYYKISSKEMALYIWIFGIAILLIKEIIKYISFNKKLRNLSDDVEKEEINNVLEACKTTLNIDKKIIIKECTYIKSPMITGIINPVITIPKMEIDEDKLEMIFKHELVHYKRKDLWIKVIALIVNKINWFNPIVYILRNNINTACELSIDEVLVKNMDKAKRKYYVKIILELLENSRNKSLAMGTALYDNKRELESRLRKIMYFKKSPKIILYISLFTAIIFTATSIFASTIVFASNDAEVTAKSKSTEFAVFVSKDGLYMSDLKDNNPIVLDNDKIQSFAQPLISRDGENVAYIKNNDLYICNIQSKEIQEICKDIESYNFDSKNDLIYSTKNPGMLIYNIETKKSSNLINNEYKYYNIKCDNKDKVYASKEYEYTEGKNLKTKSLGIISYDLNNKLEKTILEGKPLINTEIGEHPTNAQILESLGSTPNVVKISTDDKYLYIWNSPNSGSTASDINQFIVYDVINNKVTDFTEDNNGGNNEGIYGLHYEDNISQNPLNSDIVAINEGVNRDMFYNKNLGVADIKSNNFVKLLPEGQVSMTPCYSNDGRDILYSESNKLDGKSASVYKDWQNQPHNIYEINTETQTIKQITNGKHFDFMPKYLLNNEILFVRGDGDTFSLWKINDGAETKLGDSLNFQGHYINSWYYGHYETERVIDIFIR